MHVYVYEKFNLYVYLLEKINSSTNMCHYAGISSSPLLKQITRTILTQILSARTGYIVSIVLTFAASHK